MKKIIYITVIFVMYKNLLLSQIHLGINQNLDVYKPYTNEAQEYLLLNDKVRSRSASIYAAYEVFSSKRWSWNSGLSYKNTNHIIKDKVLGYYDYYLTHGSGVDLVKNYYYVDEAFDLRSRSHSMGLYNELVYCFMPNDKTQSSLGLVNEIYLFEKFQSAYCYSGSNNEFYDPENRVYLTPAVNGLTRSFFVSSVNTSIFYKLQFQGNEKYKLAFRLSAGTNLYSDWDQFKKYAWLGVGLEMGFNFKKKQE